MLRSTITGLLLGAWALAPAPVAAGSVRRTEDGCKNAHALLMASQDREPGPFWEAIAAVVRANEGAFVPVSDYEPGVARKVSFREYDTRYYEGGTAYVAHCGAGFTCNHLAEEILEHYPTAGSPVVYCGAIPDILENPRPAPLP